MSISAEDVVDLAERALHVVGLEFVQAQQRGHKRVAMGPAFAPGDRPLGQEAVDQQAIAQQVDQVQLVAAEWPLGREERRLRPIDVDADQAAFLAQGRLQAAIGDLDHGVGPIVEPQRAEASGRGRRNFERSFVVEQAGDDAHFGGFDLALAGVLCVALDLQDGADVVDRAGGTTAAK